MIPESIIDGKKTNWESITSFDCVLHISPNTQPILKETRINSASETKYSGRLEGSEAWKAKGATAKTMTLVTDFQQFFYNYKIPPQFPVSKGRKGKTSASNLPILFVLFFLPASFFAFVSLSPTKTAKKPRIPGAFPSLVLFLFPASFLRLYL